MVKQGLKTGEVLDSKYRIEKLLGQGGMGAVYRAIHLGTKRIVAVKVINPQFSINAEFIERFRREAETAGRLRHPNVVDVTDFGFADVNNQRVAYLVMEYLDGFSLADILNEEGKLPLSWVVDIFEQVCSAVNEAHRLGIIHRDLKPDNIWLEPNRLGGYTVKVLDFGLVKIDLSKSTELESPSFSTSVREKAENNPELNNSATLIQATAPFEAATQIKEAADLGTRHIPAEDKFSNSGPSFSENAGNEKKQSHPVDNRASTKAVRTTELTRVGSIMGTPLYMSPEQCRGEQQLDAQSDIYSLGIIAYRMITGETPFTGTPLELLKSHETAEPPPIRDKNFKIPKKTANLVMAALSKKPEQRPESAAGFAGALRVSTEGSGYLLRSAISLYSEHFPSFFKISLFAYAPLILIVSTLYLTDTFDASGMIISAVLFIAMIISNLLAYFIVSAATVPMVIQLILAPLRFLRIKTAFLVLRRRWRVFTLSSIAVTALILFGTILFIIPGIIAAAAYVLYAPVVVTENLNVRASLKRAYNLMKRNWSTVLIITILQFTLPILVWYASMNISFAFKLADDWSPKEMSFHFSMSGTSSIYQLLNIFVTPLTAIMTALLYLKTRRAGGESLTEAVNQIDELEIPGSKLTKSLRNSVSS